MAIKSAGTYMQLSNLCRRCSKQSFCGNGMTDYFCTGYEPTASDIKVPPFTDGQKEVIEATEKLAKKCDKINAEVNKWGEKRINKMMKKSEVILNAGKSKPMTNEDWLKSMTTEELAEWIYRAMFYKSCQKDVEDGAYMQMMTKKDYIEMWLKQPHTKGGES